MKELSPYFFRSTNPPAEEGAILFNEPVVDEVGFGFLDHWRVLRKHRRLILGCTFIVLLATVVFIFTRIPLYTAQTTLLIEHKPPQVLRIQEDLSESASTRGYDYNKTQYEVLKSRTLAARVIRDEGLENKSFITGQGEGADEKGSLLDRLWVRTEAWVFPSLPKTNEIGALGISPELINAYLSMIEIGPVRGTKLVKISFRAHPLASKTSLPASPSTVSVPSEFR